MINKPKAKVVAEHLEPGHQIKVGRTFFWIENNWVNSKFTKYLDDDGNTQIRRKRYIKVRDDEGVHHVFEPHIDEVFEIY